MKLRTFLAELVGTAILAMAVVGSGIMATNLTKDIGLQLFIVAFATFLILAVLIQMLGPISGAHFNPVVTVVALINKSISAVTALNYILTQVVGGLVGVIIANVMFKLPAIGSSTHAKTSSNLLLSEVVATAGLILVIQIIGKQNEGRYVPLAVAGWIGSAYFFTSSTTFANPAVTFARAFSDTFTGIELSSVPGFVIAELIGALIGLGIAKGLSSER
ncbi:MAG: aquaporin family protein [Streptomycetaceae bacterium]|nr:MAG: aquaporin family protein [Streptomycetaceae bacterium]